MINKTNQEQYDDSYTAMMGKFLDFIDENTRENNNGPWSEGQFDAAKDVEDFIHSKIRELYQ